MFRQGRKFNWMIGCALLASSAMLNAQQAENRVTNSDEIRQQIQQARTELAEAARRMAQLQRQLGAFDGDEGAHDIAVWHGESDELRMTGMPPRLGVLLGGPESGRANEIIGLTPGSGAETAGIEQGDRLVSVNGQPVAEGAPGSIREALNDVEPGTTVKVVVERNGGEFEYDVETSSVLRNFRVMVKRLGPDRIDREREIVIMRPDGPHPGADAMPPAPPFPPLASRFFGLGRTSDLISNHPGLQPYFGTADGVVVLRIDPENAFSLRDGDVVLSLDNEPVQRPVDLGRLILSRDAGEQVVIEVMRESVLTQLTATIPERTASIRGIPMKGIRTIEFETELDSPEAPEPPEPPATPQLL